MITDLSVRQERPTTVNAPRRFSPWRADSEGTNWGQKQVSKPWHCRVYAFLRPQKRQSMGLMQLARSLLISVYGSELRAVHGANSATARLTSHSSASWPLLIEIFWGSLMVYFLLSVVSMVMFVHVEFGFKVVLSKYLR